MYNLPRDPRPLAGHSGETQAHACARIHHHKVPQQPRLRLGGTSLGGGDGGGGGGGGGGGSGGGGGVAAAVAAAASVSAAAAASPSPSTSAAAEASAARASAALAAARGERLWLDFARFATLPAGLLLVNLAVAVAG